MRPVLLAAAIAIGAVGPVFAQAPQGCPPINLREFQILAEIHNPQTGARVAIRADCSDQDPLLCTGGPSPADVIHLDRTVASHAFYQSGRVAKAKPWPELVLARIVPVSIYPAGIVGIVAFGAGGYAVASDHVLLPRAAAFSELRSEKGFSARMRTVKGGRRDEPSDIRLTVWLLTPEELAARDAAAEAGPGKPGAGGPKRKGRRR